MFLRNLVNLRSALTILTVASCAACGAPERHIYEPIAHHTIRSGADSESDVVWLQKYTSRSDTRRLLRCSAPGGIPRCDAVNEAATSVK